MKKITNKLFVMALSALMTACVAPVDSGEKLFLRDDWTLSDGTRDFPAEVPSTVMSTLVDAGLYQDIFVGTNYWDQDRTAFDIPWSYTTEFPISVSEGQNVTLNFEGLSYYADIWLNGTQIASADTTYGAYRRWSYDVTDLLEGKNTLTVTLKRAQSGDLGIGFVDWNPRPLDESMGIFRDVFLAVSGKVAMKNTFVEPKLELPSMKSADLIISTELTNNTAETVSGVLRGTIEGATFEVPYQIEGNATEVVKITPAEAPSLRLENPRVWWCYTMGSPELYDLELVAYVDSAVSDHEDVTFGVRDIRAELDSENHRQFYLNGEPVLIKGAGWTDQIFLQDTRESIETQVRYVMDMNMNTIRFENIWGNDRYVYELCDRYGLLAMVGWSCFWEWEAYCGIPEDQFGCIREPEDIELALNYFNDQVKWLRNHASVIGWLVGSDCLPQPELERAYLKLYDEIDYRPYVGAAKGLMSEVTGYTGTKMVGPYEYVGPNYWYTDNDNKYGGAHGFNTETGIGAQLPMIESLRKFIPEDKLWPLGEEWDKHCTTSGTAMNSMEYLTGVINGKYGEASDLEDYLKKAYAVDYDGTKAMFEAFRVRLPHTTGLIQWMLNSAWPSLYWQVYDYYLVPTASYYGIKRANMPVQLIYDYKDKSLYAVNESGKDVAATAVITLYNADGTLRETENVEFLAQNRTPVKVSDLSKKLGDRDNFLQLNIIDGSDKVIAENFYCLPAAEDIYDWDNSSWYATPITRYADMSFVSNLAGAEVEMEWTRSDMDGKSLFTVTLTNNSDVLAYQNQVVLLNDEGERIVPAFWSDNFIEIPPHESRTLTCTVDAEQLASTTPEMVLRTWNTI